MNTSPTTAIAGDRITSEPTHVRSRGDVASVPFAVVGAGGLGCPALLGLLAAGARHFIVVDPDVVEVSNLQRQVLYSMADVGMAKVDAAAFALRKRCIDLDFVGVRERIDPDAALAFIGRLPEQTIVLECSDDPHLKFALNDACLERGVPIVIGAALGLRAQVLAVRSGRACYRCFYESPPLAPMTCDGAGVLGSAVGLAGALMAALGCGLVHGGETGGRLLAIDLSNNHLQTLAPRARPDCPACGRARPRS